MEMEDERPLKAATCYFIGEPKTPRIFANPILPFIVTTVSIFLAEGLIMLMLPDLAHSFGFAFLDACLLTIIMLPLLYLFLFRPLAMHIAERKRIETEQKRLIRELADALEKVKILSGLLPICASCKKIRDEKGAWNSLERYISERSDAEFTHSICPECEERLYPEMSEKKAQ